MALESKTEISEWVMQIVLGLFFKQRLAYKIKSRAKIEASIFYSVKHYCKDPKEKAQNRERFDYIDIVNNINHVNRKMLIQLHVREECLSVVAFNSLWASYSTCKTAAQE